MSHNKNETTSEQSENNYRSENIWGWKFSMISLCGILFFVLWMAYLHLTVEPKDEEQNVPVTDTTVQTKMDSSGFNTEQ